MSLNTSSIKPTLSVDISSKINVQPLNLNTNLDILNHNDDASDDACNNKSLVKQLIKKRRQLNKDIQNMHKLISQHKKTIKFDDRTKYLCKTCRCYRNERWYSK